MNLPRTRLLAVILALSWTAQCAAQNSDYFVGKVVTEWLDDGRRMKLVEPFAYVDQVGVRWDAPAGWVVDGASIPRAAWSVIGGPFEGKYRNASVIHDVACEQKQRPWPYVHRVLYTAMLAAGVDSINAKIMYAAVYQFGPRWAHQIKVDSVPLGAVESTVGKLRASAYVSERVETQVVPIPRVGCPGGNSCAVSVPLPPNSASVTAVFHPLPPTIGQDDFEKLKAFVQANNPPLDAIERYRP